MNRYLEKYIKDDLEEKMVFIGGPRQVGKTTMSRTIGNIFFNKVEYLNWDVDQDQKNILRLQFSPDAELLIFDEIHKYKNWKNHVKGFYDSQTGNKIIVTGSARLDLYRKGGDSMMGRYHYHRLHPFSLAELSDVGAVFDIEKFEEDHRLFFSQARPDILEALMAYGNFPEPYLKQNKRFSRRWCNERKIRLVREDIRDIENIREMSLFQILVNALPEKAGSIFSINSLREDLKLSHQTISRWVDILDNFYYSFRIYPYNASQIKSLKKEPKLYLWDYSEIKDEAARFENLIASHLLKFTHFLYDIHGISAELKYLRDIDQREVDFLITIDNQPKIAIEVKRTKQKIATPLKYFTKKLNIPYSFQVIMDGNVDFQAISESIRVISADKFLTAFV